MFWAAFYSRWHECRSKESWCYRQMDALHWKRELKTLHRHVQLPYVLLQPTYTIGRTTKWASEKWHTMVLGNYSLEGLWSHQEWADQNLGASMLWPKGLPHHTSGWVHEGPRCIATSERQICHVSRTLTPVETRYCNIEGEFLSVRFGLERPHHYTFGS